MFIRNLSLLVCLLLASLAGFGQGFVFQLPGSEGVGNQIVGLGDDDFNRQVTGTAPAQASQVLATPDGSKFYIISPAGIQSALTSPTAVAGRRTFSSQTTIIVGSVTSAAVTPDGKYLLAVVAGNPGDAATTHFYIVSTSSNSVAAQDVGVGSGAVPVGFAASRDSQTVYVLSKTSQGSEVAAASLVTFQAAGQPLAIQREPAYLALSPLNLLYMTPVGDGVYEIDPATLTFTPSNPITFPALSGPLHFSPDGTVAYSINKNAPCSNCPVLFQLNVASHSVSAWPTPTSDFSTAPAKLDDILVASPSRVFGLCSTCSGVKLWDVTSSPLKAEPSAFKDITFINFVTAAAISSERPEARFLYLLITNGFLYTINISGHNFAQLPAAQAVNSVVWFTPIPALSGATNIVALNQTLTVTTGSTSAPLIGYVTDAAGRAVYNQSVCFKSDSGVTITRPSQASNADGNVQTTITAPTTPGSYAVTLSLGPCGSASNVNSTYAITVSTSTGGGGGGGGTSQISIYSGNGQLLLQNTSTSGLSFGVGQPLTVKITNTDGITPIEGAPVSFLVQSDRPNDRVDPANAVTDANGLASTVYRTSTLPQGLDHSFRATTITASSQFGSVQFIETTHNQDSSSINIGHPTITVPDTNRTFSIMEGEVRLDWITALTAAGNAPHQGEPIPNIGIRLTEPFSRAPSKILSCQGSNLGDKDGISHCNVFASCQPAGTNFNQTFTPDALVSEFHTSQLTVTLIKNNKYLLSIFSGNGQHGAPTASFNLVAKVTDGCGRVAPGAGGLIWDASPKGPGGPSINQSQDTADGDGTVTARVTLGSTPGPVQITVSGPAGSTPVTFQLTTDVVASSLSVVSGDAQSAVLGQTFTNPVVFKAVTSTGTPVAGVVVNFSVTGNATLNPGSATTNAQGQVQTTVTAVGTTPGNILVTATTGSVSIAATLTSRAPGPTITGNSFTNAASKAVGMTPCGLVTVTGAGLAPNVTGSTTAQQAGLTITANGTAVPILSVSNINGVQSANFQAPCQLTPGTATVVVNANGSTNSVGVQVLAAQPGIFVVNSDNNGYVLRAANPSLPVSSANPPRSGDTLYMIVTGLGSSLTPTAVTGELGAGQNVNLSIGVQINGTNVPVPSVRYAAGLLGVYIVEFQVPTNTTLGVAQNLTIAAIVNGVPVFGNTVVLPPVIAP